MPILETLNGTPAGPIANHAKSSLPPTLLSSANQPQLSNPPDEFRTVVRSKSNISTVMSNLTSVGR